MSTVCGRPQRGRDACGQGVRGVKNVISFVDVINGWPLTFMIRQYCSYYIQLLLSLVGLFITKITYHFKIIEYPINKKHNRNVHLCVFVWGVRLRSVCVCVCKVSVFLGVYVGMCMCSNSNETFMKRHSVI